MDSLVILTGLVRWMDLVESIPSILAGLVVALVYRVVLMDRAVVIALAVVDVALAKVIGFVVVVILPVVVGRVGLSHP